MTITNTYIKRSIISEAKFREFVRCLFLDLDPNFLTGLNRNTANRYFILIRMRIAEFCEQSSPFREKLKLMNHTLEAKRIKGKRGRGAFGKTPGFGLLQRGGKV